MKPLWLEFSAHHMRSSLLLLTVKELRLAVSESSTYQIQKMAKELLINTILTRFTTLHIEYASLDVHKTDLLWFQFFFSNSLKEIVTRHLMMPNSGKFSCGILGHLKAWYDVNELTERGGLHAHMLIWLHGFLTGIPS